MTDFARSQDPRASVAWHVGDVLSLVMGHDVSPRGSAATDALREHLLGTVKRLPPGMELVTNELVVAWLASHFPAMEWFTDADRPHENYCRSGSLDAPQSSESTWLYRRSLWT